MTNNSGEWYKASLKKMNENQVSFAKRIGISIRQSQRYAAGQPIPKPITLLIFYIQLAEMRGPK